MIAVQLVGFTKSGKTTAAVALAQELQRRGRVVVGAKSSHHPLDTPATDTARLAGACTAVAGLSPHGAALFWPRQRYLADLLPLLGGDALVVEGGKSLGWLPRVLVLRNPEEAAQLRPELALATWGPVGAPGLPQITDMADLADLVLARGFSLPGLDCGACGREDCAGLTRDIVAGQALPAECQARGGSLAIEVGGVPLAMNPFVAELVAGTLRGLLGGLKGYAPGDVTIRFRT